MNDSTATRRGVIAAVGAGVGLAGCLSGSDDDGTDDGSSEETDDSTELVDGIDATDLEARRERMPDPAVTVDWSEAREFRAWLFDDGNRSNGRFDYTEDLPPIDDDDSPVLEVLDGYPEQVDGLLSQGTTQVVLGQFDADEIEARLEDGDVYDVRDEYGGYVVAEDEGGEPIAVGEDAVVIGTEYERPIDARHGDRDRLEDVDPWMTHVLETLPADSLVTGEFLTPVGEAVDVAEIYCWGLSMADREAETATWTFVFDRPDDITDDVRSEIESVAAETHDLETDGRTLTLEGAVPEPPDGHQ
ncbi:hypothetical protein RBH26_07535 [Natronolimnohabitans sp. A-GB9]|uniref:hypothetical protein n=1 Tax=Natronolimnohabitans sp. A-GB9 TaxID=3069757 RepID=UPI0027B122C9|nr:hypothetical protein [Natronolimnohabitans sp. A-GB9]MDQ2050335.1 hypothetical protein [Natronolimnohabitans sp. A-GB9]